MWNKVTQLRGRCVSESRSLLPSPTRSVFSVVMVVDSAKITDSQVLKRELLVAPYILLPSPPQKWKHLQYSANGDFLVQTQGSYGCWRAKQFQVNRALESGLVCSTGAWAARMFGDVIKYGYSPVGGV